MSNKLLSAALAALTLAACEEPTRTEPKRPPVTSVIPSKAPLAVEVRDAGTPLAAAPDPQDAGHLDALAIAHDSPTFDHLARSQQLAEDGDFRGGLVEARRALFSTPEDEDTLSQIAKLARRVKQPQLSAEAWGRLGVLRPADPSPMLQQGHALLEAKDYPGAIVSAREAIARDEGNPEGYQLCGLAQLSLDQLSGAIASFERAVELAPTHGWPLNNLGFAYLRANENEAAVRVLEKAAGILPNVAAVQNNLGVALERVGRPDEAKAAYQRAMDLSPRYVKARLNAARMAKVQLPTDEPTADSVSDIPADAHPFPAP